MKVLNGFLVAVFALLPAVYGQTGETFCPREFCVEIGAGRADLGDRCFLVKDKAALIRLYDRVEKSEGTGVSDTEREALANLNAARKKRNLTAVTLDNFASSQIAFLAISLEEIAANQKPVVDFEKEEGTADGVCVELRITVVPDLGERKSLTTPNAFYRIVAIEKPFLTQFGVASWPKAKLTLNTPTEENIDCIVP